MVSFLGFRCLVAASVVTAASAIASFSSVSAQLQANVTLQANRSYHLGGFCFGEAAEGTSKAAEVHVKLQWPGSSPLKEMGPVMLVAFDAGAENWATIKDTLGHAAGCDELLSRANWVRQLGETLVGSYWWFRINVHQEAARDWHFAVVTCGAVEQVPLALTLVAVEGALNMFEANTHFNTNSCPDLGVEESWWISASDEASFWMLLVGAVLVGAAAVLAVVVWQRLRAKAKQSSFQHSATSGAAPVIGRPCGDVVGEKVVDGQPNKDLEAAEPGQRITEA
mmetsp:Transcript_53617/g.100505  ORF Transcript_53617/g.100505 Transcript_53617/m.100505 type:complete len:281 (+) Transcript_53617:52-894(+)